VLQILSGTYLIVFYAIDIMNDICKLDDSMDFTTKQSAVITALIRLLITILYCYLLFKCRRRVLYLSACFMSGITSITLSIFLYVIGDATKSYDEIIIIAVLMLLYISFNAPLMLFPGIMIGELLPLQVRHWSGIIFTAFNLMLFGIAKVFPYLHMKLRSRGFFGIFGTSCLCAFVLCYYMLPESKNRTLGEIEDYYRQPNWIWQRRTKKVHRNDRT